MTRTKNQKNENIHLVLISDENGIFDAFLLIKKELIANAASCLSLVYAIPKQKQHPLFEQELTFLEKRFSQSLLVYKVAIDFDSGCISQEFIEALINSNMSEKMTFLLFGNDEFISSLSEILNFLNAKQIIKAKIIK
jgi:hypothetical protein